MEVLTAFEQAEPRDDGTPGLQCFLCERCGYPICTSDDILLAQPRLGTTELAFGYQLDYLLDLDDSAPCYSADETIDTCVTISQELADQPLPPAARVLAIEAILESRRVKDLQQRATISRNERIMENLRRAAVRRAAEHAHNNGSGVENAQQQQQQQEDEEEEGDPVPLREEYTELPPPPEERYTAGRYAIRRYGESKTSRIDLVCLRDSVLRNGGVQLCTVDRSAAARTPEDFAVSEEAKQLAGMPGEIIQAACRAPPPTEWVSPGNYSVKEAFIEFSRTTSSGICSWFNGYRCTHRIQCPDCRLGLGYYFQLYTAESSRKRTWMKMNEEDVAEKITHPQQRQQEGESEAMSENEEKEAETAAPTEPQKQSPADDAAGHGAAGTAVNAFPDKFLGLELKHIVQRKWTLKDFQARYVKAEKLECFRKMFPEAEELQSLFSRLTALRTQNELYSSLLRKHKEQNEVQTHLLLSQKERLSTYDEKLRTMEQIIEAQKLQLDMQTRQLANQEHLLTTHRERVSTQQQQIEVEQLLLAEQNRTIETQREQLRLMQAHMEAADIQGHIEQLRAPRQEISHATTSDEHAGAEATAPATATTATTVNASPNAAANAGRSSDYSSRVASLLHRCEALQARTAAVKASNNPNYSSASPTADSTGTTATTTAAAPPTSSSGNTTDGTGDLPPLHLRGVYGSAQRPSPSSPPQVRKSPTEAPHTPTEGHPSRPDVNRTAED